MANRFFSHIFGVLTVTVVLLCSTVHAQGPDSAIDPVKAALNPEADESLENFPGFRKFYRNSLLTIVPIPVFSTMPDEGQTYGIMPTFLVTGQNGRTMKTIVAPLVGYNTIIKAMGTASVLIYPSKHSTLSLFAGIAQEFYQEYELIFNGRKLLDDNVFIDIASRYYRNPFGRFFGLGPDSPKSAKTYFTANTYLASVTAGYSFTSWLRLGVTERFYFVDLKDGIDSKRPNTTDVYAPAQGVEDSRNLTNSLFVTFNSNGFNTEEIPTFKTEVSGSFLFSANGMGSRSSFSGADAVFMETVSYGVKKQFSTVMRFHCRRLVGGTIPFFEMPSLGGPNELRGYTAGRFVDKGAGILQIEQRNHVAHINFFNRAAGDLYIDPFFEVGQVFHAASDITWNNLQPVGGLGFRVNIEPSLIARVDVGFSREENFQVFTVLNYPF